ncbi:MAG: hypothetical protein K5651_05145, partial [Bacteroidales bacterium]|nr:hypothetical protein [Bacteroidales bacterium]
MKYFRTILLVAFCLLMGLSVLSAGKSPAASSGEAPARAKSSRPAAASKDEPEDSIVRLLRALSLYSIDIEGATVRKAFGTQEDPVTFLHNNTYLICDTAYWYVDESHINAIGHVKILQERTQLTSDKLVYWVDKDLAEFRGSLVQLQDEDHNVLRTRYLDYNTKDSVAVFTKGGSMRDKDGQLIESEDGTYDSKIKVFTFENDVNMFTDSIFIKTASLVYESDRDFATFGYETDVWKDENMLSSNAGWYNRRDSLFFFRRDVHMMNDDQEGWCDTLYYFRNTGNLKMLGHVQVSDTTRNTFSLAGRMDYVDSLSQITLYDDPAVMMLTEEEGRSKPDSLWFGADTMIYRAVYRFNLDEAVVKTSQARLDGINVDPVGEYRKQAAKTKAEQAAKSAEDDPNSAVAAAKRREAYLAAQKAKKQPKAAVRDTTAVRDTIAAEGGTAAADTTMAKPAADTTAVKPSADSTAVKPGADSTSRAEGLRDSTRIGFLTALRNVKMFRDNMQVSCDSLEYNDVDSLARMYINPVIWNEGNHQYSADSIYALIRNYGMEKANLLSNSFIAIREDSLHFDQIKSTESVAYFEDNVLARYDALGGANALFYIEEKGSLATVNTKETKMMSCLFKDRTIERVYYFDAPKSNAYPTCQMSMEDQRLKGFNWDESRRPRSRKDVTTLPFKPTQRQAYAARPRASYRHSERYFPGYIKHIYELIARGDSLERVREQQKIRRDSLARIARIDSLARADSLDKAIHLADSLARLDSLANADSLKKMEDALKKAQADSVAAVLKDSIARADSIAASKPLSKKELRAKQRAERIAAAKAKREADKLAAAERRRQREAAREARWAELDKRDSIKAAQKAEKALQKERER